MAASRAAALLESLSERDFDFDGSSKGRSLVVAAAALCLVVLGIIVWRLFGAAPPLDDAMGSMSASDIESVDSALESRSQNDSASASGADRLVDVSSGETAQSDIRTSGPQSGQQIMVHVAGAVLMPGVVRLSSLSRVVDAIAAAGGLRSDADPDRLNLAAPLEDGLRVVVPIKGQDPPAEIPMAGTSGSNASAAGKGSSAGASGGGSGNGLVNINTADATELEQLPGVGPATAAAIIAKREKDGPFASVDALIDVRGIGEAKLEGVRDLVTVGG